MKYFNILVLLVILGYSWNQANQLRPVSVETHQTIQASIADFIRGYIAEQVDGAKNLRFSNLWTEPVGEKRLKAVFKYSFEAPDDQGHAVITELSGTAMLSRDTETQVAPVTAAGNWSLDSVEVNNEVIEFKEGSRVPAPTAGTPAE